MLGPLLPVKAVWESLRISQCLRNLGFSRKQIAAAAANLMSRLIDPSSEYARSQGRKQKEKSIFSKAETRFLKQAQKLDHQLKNRRLTDSNRIHQAMGRLKAQNSRVQRFYSIELRNEDDPREGLLFESREHELRDYCELFGCYALRTESQNFAAEELWRVYISA